MKIMFFTYYVLQGIWKFIFKNYNARYSSNVFLKQVLPLLEGDVINVSGWVDSDKQGNYYRNYYKNIRSYSISNIEGSNGMPLEEQKDKTVNWVFLDLDKPVREEFKNKYDVVFNHTVLEHIFETRIALQNLIDMTKDIVVIVIPFSQSVHYTKSYLDYVRLSPYYFKRFFEMNGLKVLYCNSNDNPFSDIYVTIVASKKPEHHGDIIDLNVIRYDVQIKPSRFGKYGVSGLNSD